MTGIKYFTLAAALAGAVLTLPLITPAPAAPKMQAGPSCSSANDLSRIERSLPRLAARLAQGGPVKIVAFGSSSTEGVGASSPAHSYPARLEATLRARFPNVQITVVNLGIGGEDAEEMLSRIDRVIAEQPDLIIWQVGTNAMLGELDLSEQAAMIRTGLVKMKTVGADIVLMNSQYAPAVIEKGVAPQMAYVLETLANEGGLGLFRRFEIMRHWNTIDQVPFSQFISEDELHMNDWSYDCVAKLLATGIVEAAAKRPVWSARASLIPALGS
jgi:lysophospholipase L1-like esterase